MDLLETDLTAAMRSFTEPDEVSPTLIEQALGAPRRARRRRRLTAAGSGVLAVAAVAGIGTLAMRVRDPQVAAPAAIIASPPAVSTALPTPQGPPDAAPASGLSAADAKSALETARSLTIALFATKTGQAFPDTTGLSVPALAAVLQTHKADNTGTIALGLLPGLVQPIMVGHDVNTTVVPTLLADGMSADGTPLALVDLTVTSYAVGESEEYGTTGGEYQAVVTKTGDGWRATSFAGVASLTINLPFDRDQFDPPRPASVPERHIVVDTQGPGLLVEGQQAADAYAREFTPKGSVPPGHGTPTVVIQGPAGAVVDIPGVEGATMSSHGTGTLRLTFDTRDGLVTSAPLGY